MTTTMAVGAARRIAFIGSRDLSNVPTLLLDAFRELARGAAVCGASVVTGAAPGADQIAATIAVAFGGQVHLVLPWTSFEQRWVQWALSHGGVTKVVYDPTVHAEWTDSVFRYHPAGGKLAHGALALHARNYGIVCGAELVIALPGSPNAGRFGGTVHGLRLANTLGVPAYNLWDDREREAATRLLAPAVKTATA